MQKCSCGETDPNKFYGHKKSVCGACHNKYTIAKGLEKRAFAIKLLGGCCKACGYNKYPASLDIHHLDPSVKDRYFASMRGWSDARIEAEMQKCVLLCRNCHAAYHAGYSVVW